MFQLDINQDQIREFCQKNAISYMALFGSHARGEANQHSDVDIVVRFKKRIGLFEHIRVEDDFSNMLHKEVDMLTEGAVSPYLKENIQKDLITIYEEKN